MKKMMNLAVVAVMTVLCAVFTGCDTKSDAIVVPAPSPTTTPDTTPEKPTTTDWRWSIVGDQTLDFFVDTEIVEAKNIGQLTRLYNGNPETKLDSVILRYQLGVELKAPKRVVVESKDTTVLGNARTATTLNYGEYVVSANKDSVCSVSTDHVFPTSYYNISATTTSKRGYSLHAGHWESFKYVTEKAQWSKIWHEPITEVTINDSVCNREVVHNELVFKITSNKGNSWYVSREEVVVVDHFLRMKEKSEEPEQEETAEFDIPDYVGVQAYVRSYDVIMKRWNDAILIDAKEAYYIVTIPFVYNKEKDKEQLITSNGKIEKHIQKWSKSEVGETKEYNSVLNYQGTFYPAAMTVDAYGWYCVFNKTIDQSIDMNQATISGLKNQPKNGNAKGDPRVEHAESKSASGQVVTITGTTIGHTIATTIKIK